MKPIIACLLTMMYTYPLTAPVDIPPAPKGVSSPGGRSLPTMMEQENPNSPRIGMATEATFPGETLLVTGENLDGATLKVWAEGKLTEITPLRTWHNRMQAVIPETLPTSTMLVWPLKADRTGAPFRVNGATAWWCWPCRFEIGRDTTVRVFGKNLALRDQPVPGLVAEETNHGPQPVVCAEFPDGTHHQLELVCSNPYHVEAKMPAGIQAGTYALRVHNGTGGKYGWSRPVTFRVVETMARPNTVYRADDFDPPPYVENGAGGDAGPAIQQAIDLAARNGGGIVQLSRRFYELKSPLILPPNSPITLRGAGRGTWNPKNNAHEGDGTVLVVKEGTELESLALITVRGDGSRVEDLTVQNLRRFDGPGRNYQHSIHLGGPDQEVSGVRLYTVPNKSQAIWTESNDDMNARIVDSELFYGARGALRMLTGNYVLLQNCDIYGMYHSGAGTDADAVRAMANSYFIIEGNRFRGWDRTKARVLGRTYIAYNQSVRYAYLADNASTEVGVHESLPGVINNVSEQYLFHTAGGADCGIVRVKAAGARTLEVEPASLVPMNKEEQREKQVIPGSGKEETFETPDRPNWTALPRSWVALVVAGKGIGQWRELTTLLGTGVYELDRPWRIVPDDRSWVVIQRMFRHHIFYNNYINTSPNPDDFQMKLKSTGFYLFHNALDNIIANNKIERVAQGIALGGFYSTPTAWNLIRDNEINHIHGWAGGTTHVPMFINDHIRENPWKGPHNAPGVWYSMANVFRHNKGRDADMIGSVGFKERPINPELYRPSPDKGLMMTVVEHNDFSAERGFVLYGPANWTLIRNNRFEVTGEGNAAVEFYEQNKPFILDPLILDQK